MKCLSLLFEWQGSGRIHLEKKRGEKALGDERKGAPDPRAQRDFTQQGTVLVRGQWMDFQYLSMPSIQFEVHLPPWPPAVLTFCCLRILFRSVIQSTWEVKGRWSGLAYAWEKGLQMWALSRNSEQEGTGMVVSLSSPGKPLDLDIKAKDDCPWRPRNSDKPQEDLLIK